MATRVKEKAKKRAEAIRRPTAHAKHIRISQSKVSIVLNLIRGKSVDEALAILSYTPKSASEVIVKVLKSAIANAENNMDLNRDDLYISETYANPGPTIKRMRPVAKGAGHSILKRTSHITVILDLIK